MAERLVTRGIVLRETRTKETDKILTLLTPQGRYGVVARGARGPRSRIAAASELLAYSEVVLAERRGWYMLDEATTLRLFDGLRADVEKLALASYFAELAEAVTEENYGAEDVLALLLNALHALERLDRPAALLKGAYELRLMALSGYEPQLGGCAVCRRETPREPVFDPREGVVLCRACALGAAGGLRALEGGALEAMRHVLRSEKGRVFSFALAPPGLSLFSRACESFVLAQLERSFRTLDYYHKIKTYSN